MSVTQVGCCVCTLLLSHGTVTFPSRAFWGGFMVELEDARDVAMYARLAQARCSMVKGDVGTWRHWRALHGPQ